jgi:hypothetical protein
MKNIILLLILLVLLGFNLLTAISLYGPNVAWIAATLACIYCLYLMQKVVTSMIAPKPIKSVIDASIPSEVSKKTELLKLYRLLFNTYLEKSYCTAICPFIDRMHREDLLSDEEFLLLKKSFNGLTNTIKVESAWRPYLYAPSDRTSRIKLLRRMVLVHMPDSALRETSDNKNLFKAYTIILNTLEKSVKINSICQTMSVLAMNGILSAHDWVKTSKHFLNYIRKFKGHGHENDNWPYLYPAGEIAPRIELLKEILINLNLQDEESTHKV